MDIVFQAGEPGRAIINTFTHDHLVNSLLLLYGLHPLDLQLRVLQALEKVRPYLNSHGGNVELLGVIEDEGIVRLRLQGNCKSCPSSAMTLKLAIEEAIYEAAPDVIMIETEGVVEQPSPSGSVKFKGDLRDREIPIPVADPEQSRRVEPHPVSDSSSTLPTTSGGWEEVRGLKSLNQGSLRVIEVSGYSVLFCRVGETFYAYSNICPNCGWELSDACLEAGVLVCFTCGQRYDVIRAGRGLDESSLHLEPFPLLVEGGHAKVALPVL